MDEYKRQITVDTQEALKSLKSSPELGLIIIYWQRNIHFYK